MEQVKDKKPLSLRDQILASKDFKVKKVHVAEWGVDVWVREMSSAARLSFQKQHVKRDAEGNFMLDSSGNAITDAETVNLAKENLLVRTLVNEKGEPIFKEEDVPDLAEKCGRVLEDLYEEAAELNGIGERNVEKLEKNSRPSSSVASALN